MEYYGTKGTKRKQEARKPFTPAARDMCVPAFIHSKEMSRSPRYVPETRVRASEGQPSFLHLGISGTHDKLLMPVMFCKI
jgi:hypothetical protein